MQKIVRNFVLALLFLSFNNSWILNANDIVFEDWVLAQKKTLSENAAQVRIANAFILYQTNQKDSAINLLVQALELLDETSYPTNFIELNRLIGQLYVSELQVYEKAKPYLSNALQRLFAEEQVSAYLSTLDWLTASYYWLFESEEAIKLGFKGLEIAENKQHKEYQILFNQWIGRTLVIQGKHQEAMNYYEKMLALVDKTDQANLKYEANLNIACLNHKMSKSALGLEYLENCSYYLTQMPPNDELEADVWMWKGIMNGSIGNTEQAIALLNQALVVFERLEIAHRRMHTRLELGSIYLKKGSFELCIKTVDDALALSPSKITPFEEKFGQTLLYIANRNLNDLPAAIQNLETLRAVESRLDSINDMKYIQELEKQYKVKEQQQLIEQQEITISKRRWLGIAVVLMSLLLIGTFFTLYVLNQKKNKLLSQNQVIEQQSLDLQKSNNQLTQERNRSEELLLNILPSEVAEELKNKGSSPARTFEEVTILFTDFEQFTMIAERHSAEELVEEINVCFKAFDEIVTKYDIEKIKTIGDAYMAVGGLHFPHRSKHKEVILAAIEMQNFLLERSQLRKSKDQFYFGMRCGIHTGSVVAGIVGVKKFQYDIWGDTVNIAARMESSGEEGKVNISHYTYELVKDMDLFSFVARGKVKAKNKGAVEMYFVEASESLTV